MNNLDVKKMQEKNNAQKAQEEKEAKWEAVHGINRHEHNRLLLAGYHDDYDSNEEWYRVMKINEAIKTKEKEMGEEE